MNKLMEFNFKENSVKAQMIDGKPYFLFTDIANILEYKNNRDALRYIKDEDLKTLTWKACRETRQANFWSKPHDYSNKNIITEAGLYTLIRHSHVQKADKFNYWVEHDVLPQLRRNGAYVTPQTAEDWLNNPDMMISVLKRYKQAKDDLKQSKEENRKLIPDASFGRQVTKTKDTMSVGQLSKYLHQNNVDTGRNRLFNYLREAGYLIKAEGREYNAPTQKSMNLEIMKNKEHLIKTFSGYKVRNTPLITGKGQRFFLDKLTDIKQKLFSQDNNINLLDKD